jgi:hypothetical protein
MEKRLGRPDRIIQKETIENISCVEMMMMLMIMAMMHRSV